MIPVIGLRAGGHAKVVLDVLLATAGFQVIGLLDADRARAGSSVLGVPVLGDDSLLPRLLSQHPGLVFFVGLGSVGVADQRRRVWEDALRKGIPPIEPIVASSAVVSTSAKVGRGTVILPGAIVNTEARLGENVIVNTRAVVEHDCTVGDHAHIATGACLCGGVSVGGSSLIGAGAVVKQYLTVGSDAVVGAGACVVKNVPDGAIVVGVPARPLAK